MYLQRLVLATCLLGVVFLVGQLACGELPTPVDPGSAATEERPARPASQTSPPSSPRLTGFFDPGNFGTLTVHDERGEPERLSIKSVEVKVEVHGRMARTEVTQVFHNHTPFQTEGTYEFTLPAGAAISRLAMDVEGTLMEGELVERERARQIYDSIVNRKKDPALLEWIGGNHFRTSIFPIPGRGDKLVILGYEQLLPQYRDSYTYRYSLPALVDERSGRWVDRFSFTLSATDAGEIVTRGYPMRVQQRGLGGTVSLARRDFLPQGPIEVDFAYSARAGARVAYAEVDEERFFLLDYVPELPPLDESTPRAVVFALDTSASLGGKALERARAVVRAALDQLPEETAFNIVHGDLRAQACSAGPLSRAQLAEALACLDGLDTGGGTDLGALLELAADAAIATERPATIFLFSDGGASLGELDGELLSAHLAGWTRPFNITVHTAALGPAAVHEELAQLASQGGGHALSVDLLEPAGSVARRLLELSREPLMTEVRVRALDGTIEGLTPRRPVNLARGEALAILGRLEDGVATVRVEGRYGDRPITRTFKLEHGGGAGSPLLRDFWARRVLGEMQRGGLPRDKIVETSLHYGVMSRHTSFLVLENEAAYERFQIERRKGDALAAAGAGERGASGNLRKSSADLSEVLAQEQERPARAESRSSRLAKLLRGSEGSGSSDLLAGKQGRAGRQDSVDTGRHMASRSSGLRDFAPDPERLQGVLGGSGSTSTFGVGSLRLAGRGGGAAGYGGGGGGLGGKAGRNINISQGSPIVMGSLDKEIIRRIIRQNITQIRYCYERELTRSPGLYGKIMVKFIIAATGRVSNSSIAQTTMKNAAVESCIAGKVRGWRFPRPKGGGIVIVTYPFIFRQDGAPLQWGESPQQELSVTEMGRRLHHMKVDPFVFSGWLASIIERRPRAADHLVRELLKDKRYSPVERLRVLTSYRAPWERYLEQRFELLSQVLQSDNQRPWMFEELVESARKLERAPEAVELIKERCPEDQHMTLRCLELLRPFGEVPGIEEARQQVVSRRMGEIKRARQQDMGNRDLILELVQILSLQGSESAARRALSELVEFAPHDAGVRGDYARQLLEREDVTGGCAQLAAVTQLDPSRREIFKEMMALRRRMPKRAPAIRRCLAEGVSQLPVKRDLSVLLTWDDPDADVDLHIVEPGGEQVSFAHRESRSGGLLYYDVRDGYGPEIFVLGKAPPGRYGLSLVYYLGSAPQVRGTLTVLRHAGTRNETREDHPFVLTHANPDRHLAITSLSF